MKRLFGLGLGLCLCLTGCASEPNVPIRAWHADADAAGSVARAVATTPDAPDAGYTVRLVCQPEAAAASQLMLQIDTPDDANLPAGVPPSGTIRFGVSEPQALAWQRNGAVLTARMPASDLAEGVAHVFRTNQPITATGLTANPGPVRFTVGQGPYEPVVSHFLASCPPTRQRMPALVRIANATLKKVPQSGLAGDDTPLDQPPPRFPPEAIKQMHEGTVKLVAAVTPEGDVLWPVIVQSTGHAELDLAALRALSQWHYPEQPLGPNELYLLHQQFTFTPHG